MQFEAIQCDATGRFTSKKRTPGDPVLRPSKIVAIGLNYLDHIREAELAVPERPLVFAKFPSSVIGPDAPRGPTPARSTSPAWMSASSGRNCVPASTRPS